MNENINDTAMPRRILRNDPGQHSGHDAVDA